MMEKKNNNKTIAAATSIGVHGVILLLFLFLVSWKAPNPPLSALGGIELNFGLDDAGTGEVQPDAPVGSDKPVEDTKVEDDLPPVEETAPDKPAEVVTSPTEENTVEIPEKNKSTVEPSVNKTESEKLKEKKPVVEPKPVSEDSKEVETATKKGIKGNHGDDKDKVGDKGSPQGTLDAKALYGNPGTGGQGGSGTGGGFALQMAGWTWDEQPKAPKLPDNENGRVVFEIEVDEEGDITSIKTIERSLSAEAEKICKQEVLRRSLVKTFQGTVPERSKGRVAFVLRTQ